LIYDDTVSSHYIILDEMGKKTEDACY